MTAVNGGFGACWENNQIVGPALHNDVTDCNGCREPEMQLQLLDRVAGCSVQATQMAQAWHQHQVLSQQLQDITAMGGPDQLQVLQDLVDSVSKPADAKCLLAHIPHP